MNSLRKENELKILDARVECALQLSEEGNYRVAFRMLLGDAKRGHAIAQTSLAYFYDLGLGVSRDRSKAIHWYRRAADQGNRSATNNLGTIYRDKGDFELAMRWFERAVELGEVESHFEIAKLYYRQKKKISKAIEHWRLVAAAQPRVEVTEWSRDVAKRILRLLERYQGIA